MCGIVGLVSHKKNGLNFLIDGLEMLEYRGYDSAGVAYLYQDKLEMVKSVGRISNLKEKLDFNKGISIGLGHTRWATHGKPNEINSHPHKIGKITIVHNGIIENYIELKEELSKYYQFKSETDTEVACALLDYLYNEKKNMLQAIRLFQIKVRGSYALGIICDAEDDKIYALKNNSPLIIGLGDNENFIASDVPAILKYTNKYYTLDDKELAVITSDKINVYNEDLEEIRKQTKIFDLDINNVSKNGYDHYMLKEINEEPNIIKKTFDQYFSSIDALIKEMPDFSKYEKIIIVACGSAIHAGMIGKSLIEEYGNIPVDIEIASEFRYKKLFLNKNDLIIAISQSGETADTLAAVKIAKKQHIDTIGIINVYESSIARICDKVIYTLAGSEIAVATTKAYLNQVAVLSLIAITIGYLNKNIADKSINDLIKESKKIPIIIQNLIDNNQYKKIASKIYKNNHLFFLGRNVDYNLAMEGSLKLKEISYIHSEAYQAGELKHGTISLIENNTPIIAITTKDTVFEKTISNIKEVKARGAEVILITNQTLSNDDYSDFKLVVPKVNDLFQPLLTIIPLQLIAYEVALLRGCDIDKPKNLAKSVTVE